MAAQAAAAGAAGVADGADVTDVASEIDRVFRAAGARPSLHVREIDGPGEVAMAADRPVVAASVFKLPVLVTLARQAAAGVVDLAERIVVPAATRSPGGTGLSAMCDDVRLSLRDLAYLMMAVSDNAATDVVMARVGLPAIAADLDALGLRQTAVVQDCAALVADLVADLGLADADEESLAGIADLDPAVLAGARALQPDRTNRTTPRDMTRLLSLVWRDEAGPVEACAEVRRILALQVWPHRLTSGFPDAVEVAGKTGTLPGVRNEVGVVTYPDGARYAVAAFTRTARSELRQPAVDAAIGHAGRLAIDALRTRLGIDPLPPSGPVTASGSVPASGRATVSGSAPASGRATVSGSVSGEPGLSGSVPASERGAGSGSGSVPGGAAGSGSVSGEVAVSGSVPASERATGSGSGSVPGGAAVSGRVPAPRPATASASAPAVDGATTSGSASGRGERR